MVFSTVTKYFTNTALTYLIKNESIKFIVKQLTSQISSFQIDYLVLVLSKLLDCLKVILVKTKKKFLLKISF